MPKKGNWGKTPWTIAFRSKPTRLPDEVDIAIIGGGFTGLAAAAMARRLAPQKSVLLLEAARVGSGASGQTGGLVLSQTAAGDLPGLGDVLKGYHQILRRLQVNADLTLPGVWELARGAQSMEGKPVRAIKNSPIEWNDSGTLRVVAKVPGGSVNPAKVVTGLARAAQKRGAQIVENAAVEKIDFSDPPRLRVRLWNAGKRSTKKITANQVLIATNAGSLDLGGELFNENPPAEPKLTFALATAPLRKKEIAEIGLSSGRPFYTVDLPYLWGRLLGNGRIVFGSGLVPGWEESFREDSRRKKAKGFAPARLWSGLEFIDVRKGDAAERLKSLEDRVRGFYPALKNIRVTHRWGGPILLTKDFMPVFRTHPKSENVIVSGGYSGHGVALSVYLGARAAEVMLGLRKANWALRAPRKSP